MSATIVKFTRRPRHGESAGTVECAGGTCAALSPRARDVSRPELPPAAVRAALAHADTRVRDWLAFALATDNFES